MLQPDCQLLLDAIADAVVAADGKGCIVYANAAVEPLLGWPPAELVGQPLTVLIPERLQTAHFDGFQRYRTTRVPQVMGKPVRVPAMHRDGSEVPIELALSDMRQGEQELFVASLRDVRDRLELERQLEITGYLRAANKAAGQITSRLELEHVLRTVVDTLVSEFDAALARVWIYDPETRALHLRASAGLSTETSASSRAVIEVEEYPYKIAEVARTREAFVKNRLVGDSRFQQEWVTREGIASAAVLPLLMADELRGVLVYFSRRELREEMVEVLNTFATIVTATLRDVELFTREQQARAATERAVERLQQLQQITDAALAHLSQDELLAELLARVRDALAVDACAIFLVEGDALVARSAPGLDAVVEQGLRVPIGEGLVGRIAAEREPVVLAEVRSGSEADRHLADAGIRSLLGVPLFVEGRVVGVLYGGTLRPRSFTAEELRLLQLAADRAALAIDHARLFQELRTANRRKDQFLAMLAHELRNPLGAASNAVTILQLSRPDYPAWHRALSVLERQLQHQSRLVDELLDVSRLIRGTAALRPQRLDLTRLVRDAADDYRGSLEQAGLTLTLELPDAPVYVCADATRLTQVLSNLLHNAQKFTPSGGRVNLLLRASLEDGTVSVSVQDTGIGIRPQLLPHIFEPFVQADQDLARSQGGLGLGLPLVQGLIGLHGGEVRAYSAGEGKGAEFTFLLPLGECPATEAGRALPDAAAAHAARRVLVIEDNPDAAETLRDILELGGHTVVTASSGMRGLEEAREFRPDVVLCDLGLPQMDGYEVAAALRRDPATAAALLIAVTGYGQEEDQRRSREAGFDRHLVKPIDPAELLKLLSGRTEPSAVP